MKPIVFSIAFSLSCGTPVWAQQEPPKPAEPAPAAGAAPVAAPGAPKESSAEDIIQQVEELLSPPDADETVEEKAVVDLWAKRLGAVDTLIADFRKRFPTHPLRWKLLFLEANSREVREDLQLPIDKQSRPAAAVYAEILAAPDADPQVKSEASAARLLALTDDVSAKKVKLEDWEKDLAAHLKSFEQYEENPMLVEMRLLLVSELANARLVGLLEELAKSPNRAISDLASSRLTMAKALAELRNKPLDLKFKALDGRDVDLAKLRGKVVLVEFWASWAAPSVAEIPTVTEAHRKFQEKGLEVVGISLDEEEEPLKRILKEKQMAWPQYFDGKGWENELAKRYGVDSIPALWLVNKKGFVVDLQATNGLEEKIEKLLAE